MRIKNLSLLLIGSLVISGVTAVNKEKAVAGETLRTKNIVADVKPGSVRSRNVLAAKGYTDDEILKLAKKYFGNNGGENKATVEIDSVEGDIVNIHIYENVDDAKKMYSAGKVTIGDLTYKLTAKKYDKTEKMNVRNIVQVSKSAGKTTSLVKKATSEKIVTNGKQLYYSKNVSNKGVIYKLDIKTKKSYKIISGKGYVLLGGTDKELYIGVSSAKNKSGYDKYTYNFKAKKLITVYD